MNESVKAAIPIDYASPVERRRFKLPKFSFLTFFAFAAGFFLLYVLIDIFIPRIETMYKDFGLRLPPSTQVLLDIETWMRTPNYIPAACIAVAAGFIAPLFRRARRRFRHRQVLLVLLAINAILLVLLVAAIIILVDPFFTLVHSVGK